MLMSTSLFLESDPSSLAAHVMIELLIVVIEDSSQSKQIEESRFYDHLCRCNDGTACSVFLAAHHEKSVEQPGISEIAIIESRGFFYLKITSNTKLII